MAVKRGTGGGATRATRTGSARAKRGAASAARRSGVIRRETKETAISVSVSVDGSGKTSSPSSPGISTGVKFIDHLVTSLGRHSMMDISLGAESRDGIMHHLVEDAAIALGGAIDKALGDRSGIVRFGFASVPMDESLAEASVDLIRRPFYKVTLSLERTHTEDVSREDLEHFFQSLLQNLNCCVHLSVRYGDNDHHKAEAAVKSLAVALRAACARDPRQRGTVPSTKGSM